MTITAVMPETIPAMAPLLSDRVADDVFVVLGNSADAGVRLAEVVVEVIGDGVVTDVVADGVEDIEVVVVVEVVLDTASATRSCTS